MRLAVITAVVAMCLGSAVAQAQRITASITFDSSSREHPLVLTVQNTRRDIRSIRLTVMPKGRFRGFAPSKDIRAIQRGPSMFDLESTGSELIETGAQVLIGRFGVHDSSGRQNYILEYFTSSGQLASTQRLTVSVPQRYGPMMLEVPQCTVFGTDLFGGAYRSSSTLGPTDNYWYWSSGPQYSGHPGPMYTLFAGLSTANAPHLWNNDKWIFPTTPPHTPRPGSYTFRRLFCATAEDSAYIDLGMETGPGVTATAVLNPGTGSASTLVTLGPNSYTPLNLSSPTRLRKFIRSGSNVLELQVTYAPGSGGAGTPMVAPAFRIIADSRIIMNDYIAGCPTCEHVDPGTRDTIIYPPARPSSITVCKIFDVNRNGRNDGEPKLSGWPVYLTPINDAGVPGTPITGTTGPNGCYTFTGLYAGNYRLEEGARAGWTATSPRHGFDVEIPNNFGNSYSYEFLNRIDASTISCDSVFRVTNTNNACCDVQLTVSDAPGVMTSLEYRVSGGVMSSLQSSPCSWSNGLMTPPGNGVNNTTAGQIIFNMGCRNPIIVNASATATNASGIVDITWIATYALADGTSKKCTTTTRVHCPRAQLACNTRITVAPHHQANVSLDRRRVTITNTKSPSSKIGKVFVEFTPEPSTVPGANIAHGGGDVSSNGAPPRNWNPSTKPGQPYQYTQVELNCSGSNAGLGVATNHGSTLSFWLSVDLNQPWPPTGYYDVRFTVIYCDGDTCTYDFRWRRPTRRRFSNTTQPFQVPGALRVLSEMITPVDSAASMRIELADSSHRIAAVTGPSPDRRVNGSVVTGSSVLYTLTPPDELTPPMQKAPQECTILFSSKAGDDDSVQVRIIYYDGEGREIGTDEFAAHANQVSSVMDGVSRTTSGELALDVRPNPATSVAAVTLGVRSTEIVSIVISDMYGQEVGRLLDGGSLVPGSHVFEFDTSGFPNGTYVVTATTRDGRAVVTKLIVSR